MRKHPETWTVGKILASQGALNFAPPYQRPGGIWSKEKQQTLVDSVLNGFDIPKFYLHRLDSKEKFHYAIVDGKQRINCLIDFMDNKFSLGDGFSIDASLYEFEKEPAPVSGDFFSDFSNTWKEQFKAVNLDFVIIDESPDVEDVIEDLFGRLNGGVPLNVTEKRHALPGLMSKYVTKTTQHVFFVEHLPIPNTRYKHEEIAIKLIKMATLIAQDARPICAFPPSSLDKIVKDGKNISDLQIAPIEKNMKDILTSLCKVFDKKDPLLSTHSLIPGYVAFMLDVLKHYGHPQLVGKVQNFLNWFESERAGMGKFDEGEMDVDFKDYTEMAGMGTTSLRNMEGRVEILKKMFLRQNSDVQIKDKVREFTAEERFAIWFRAGKQCQFVKCQKPLPTLDMMEADHVLAWKNGGATALVNAQALCRTCNSSKGARVKS
jgi:hypothetical protein